MCKMYIIPVKSKGWNSNSYDFTSVDSGFPLETLESDKLKREA